MNTPSSAMTTVACVALAAAITSDAFAQGKKPVPKPVEEEPAETLFKEALAQASKGEYTSACPKFEQSQKLDPGLGTQFNLADCYEHTDRFVLAYKLFTEVQAAAHAAGKKDREVQAEKRAAALAKRLGLVAIGVAKVEAQPGLKVLVDGKPLGEGEVARPIAVLPGAHEVVVTADGKAAWTAKVDAKAGERVALEVPGLSDAPKNPPNGPPIPMPPTANPAATPARAPTETNTDARSWQLPVGLAVGGVGIVGLGLGAAFGLISLGKHNDASAVCPSPSPCPDRDAAQLWTDATHAGTVSTVAFIAGGALAAGGAALLLTLPKEATAAARSLKVTVGMGYGTVGGAW